MYVEVFGRNFHVFSFKRSLVSFFFIVSIESVGAIPPDQLFVDAVKLLMSKCDRLLKEIDGTIQ